jgi:hypothetical protein
VETPVGRRSELLRRCLGGEAVDEQVVGIAVGREVLEAQLARGGGKVDELEAQVVGVAAEFLQVRHLAGIGQDHCVQGNPARNLALGNQILEYLGGVGGAGAADFVEAARGEL